jgi:hypothetical protein
MTNSMLLLKVKDVFSNLTCIHNGSITEGNFNLLLYFNNSLDANGDVIVYTTEHRLDGRKCISYEPTVVGMLRFYFV